MKPVITKVRSRSCPLLAVLSYLNYPSVSSKDLIFDVLKQKENDIWSTCE